MNKDSPVNIMSDIPTSELKRKSYFRSKVKKLIELTKAPDFSKLFYKFASSRDLEREYNRLNEILKRQMMNRRIIMQTTEARNVNQFFSNPSNGLSLDVTNLPIREVLSKAKLPRDFALLLKIDNSYWSIKDSIISEVKRNTTLNRLLQAGNQNFDKLSIHSTGPDGYESNPSKVDEMLLDGILPSRYAVDGGVGSDAVLLITDDKPHKFKFVQLIWKEKGRVKPSGGYFRYYHNLDKVDLSAYGLYRNSEETDRYEKNCLEIALITAGIDASIINNLKTLIKTRFIPQKDLKQVAEYLGIKIVLTKKTGLQRKNFKYGNGDKVINIGLIDEHYFLINKTKYTSYSIRNYFDIHEIKDFNKIFTKQGKYLSRRNDRFIDSFDLISILLEEHTTHLRKIDMTNCGEISNYNNKFFEYTDLPEIMDSECKIAEPKKITAPQIFKEWVGRAGNGYFITKPFDVVYFDTETLTDADIHEVFMISSLSRNENKKTFISEDCVLEWLLSLEKDSLCIAHNLRYDFQFVVKHLESASTPIKTGNMIKSVSGTFHNKLKNKRISLHFLDSYGLISMKLSDFSDCFNLKNVKKEIMPYGAYNHETVNKKSIKIDYALSFLKKSDKHGFLNNLKEWDLIIDDEFDHIKYAQIYCEMDVEVLKKGYETFRSWMLEITDINIDYCVSIPQVAYTFGLNSRVFEGCYKISGVARDFIQKCVVGGRCMTRRNEKFSVKHDVDDFDGVSLYPSAMSRMDGFLKGKPKVWNESININDVDGYFIEIEVLDIGKRRDFPLISKKNKDGIRDFSNDIRGSNIFVDKTGLEDLIKFHNIKYKILRGYYFNEGRNNLINDFMKSLFNERLKKKKEKNPIQKVYKDIMNSFYGRLIMNPIEHSFNFIYGKEDFDKHFSYHFNNITQYTEITSDIFFVKEAVSIMKHFSMPHCGVEVLSMSKRIMNEVMCLAEDNNIEIYYQDTDSMHIDARKLESRNGLTGVEQLSREFKKKYGRELVGKGLGQFHSDFDYPSEEPPISVESVYLGKKSYCDKIKVIRDSKEEFLYHSRMRSIPGKCIEHESEKNFNGNTIDMYKYLLDGKAIPFNLLDVCKFVFTNNFTTKNREEFIRVAKF